MEKVKEILSRNISNGAKSFLIANEMYKQPTNTMTYGECVKMAWKRIKTAEFESKAVLVPVYVINELLKVGYVTFGYYKQKGNEFRVFRATKYLGLIPQEYHPTVGNKVSTNLRFYDAKDGWRSCSGNTTHLYLIVDQQP